MLEMVGFFYAFVTLGLLVYPTDITTFIITKNSIS